MSAFDTFSLSQNSAQSLSSEICLILECQECLHSVSMELVTEILRLSTNDKRYQRR